ncbi:MAG: metalloregulator ArsR/SmtB family transcription factor [Chloroflexota bacterium]
MISQTLTQEVSQMEAELCSAFADPTRILILYALDEHPCNVGELVHELQVSQPTISRHLKVLRDRGLVTTVRQGTNIQYHLIDKRLIQALNILRSVMRERITYRANLMDKVDT